jgi:hypothetical protein
MTPAEELAAKVSALLPNCRFGPLEVLGWASFGRPREGWEAVVSSQATGDCIRFNFGEEDILAVWNPADVEITERFIRIGSASAIRLSWYGNSPKVPANIRYGDFALIDGSVAFRTNVDTTPGSGWLKQEIVDSHPAILIGEDY